MTTKTEMFYIITRFLAPMWPDLLT